METSCTILDLKNVTLKQVASVYGYIQEASKIGQNYYPERMGIPSDLVLLNFPLTSYNSLCFLLSVFWRLMLGRFYMINSPRGFSTVWAVIKRFLDPVTVEKIFILGKDYQPTLLAQIPKENLPKRFGGECVCPGGCDLSDAGPWTEVEWARLEGTSSSQTCTTKAESEVSIVGGQGHGDGTERLTVPRVGV